jgi:NAD(P)-dependent dehydrogenase (short-subunit alcohol dehydrogenase family)
VADHASVDAAFAATIAATNRIDVLVNNAGINGPVHPSWEYPLEAWDRVVAIDYSIAAARSCPRC